MYAGVVELTDLPRKTGTRAGRPGRSGGLEAVRCKAHRHDLVSRPGGEPARGAT
jgi:hypothetical protein